MSDWTISRRVIAGFATMLLIILALGVFRSVATYGPRTKRRGFGGQESPKRAAAERGIQGFPGQPN